MTDIPERLVPDARSPFFAWIGVKPPVLAGRDPVLATIRAGLESPGPFHGAVYGHRGVGVSSVLDAVAADACVDNARGWRKVFVVKQRVEPGVDLAAKLVERFALPACQRGTNLEDVLGFEANGPKDGSGVLFVIDDIEHLSPDDPTPGVLRTARAHGLAVDVVMGGRRPPRGNDEATRAYFADVVAHQQIRGLDYDSAVDAIVGPLNDVGVRPDPDALDRLARATGGYPPLTQLFGDRAWQAWSQGGAQGPLSLTHATVGLANATPALTAMYRERWDTLNGPEQSYILAMNTVSRPGRGAVAADISAQLDLDPATIGSARMSLVHEHGIIRSGTPFTVGEPAITFALPGFGVAAATFNADQPPSSSASPPPPRAPAARPAPARYKAPPSSDRHSSFSLPPSRSSGFDR